MTVLISCLFYWTREDTSCNIYPFAWQAKLAPRFWMTYHLFTLNVILHYEFHNDMVFAFIQYISFLCEFYFVFTCISNYVTFPIFVPFTYTSSSYQVELVFMYIVLDQILSCAMVLYLLQDSTMPMSSISIRTFFLHKNGQRMWLWIQNLFVTSIRMGKVMGIKPTKCM